MKMSSKNFETDTTNFDFFSFDDSVKKNDLSAKNLLISSNILKKLTYEAFKRLSFTFSKEHLENIIKAFNSKNASKNDKYVCACILKNAVIAAKNEFALCQDTGIATIYGWNDGIFFDDGKGTHPYEQISKGAEKAYKELNMRFSTACPTSFYEEKDPKNNMPAQVSIFEKDCALAPTPSFAQKAGKKSLSLIFCAKGGGSSNKTSFVQGTKAYLNEKALTKFLEEQISHIGTSACPPYTLAVVVGGLSPEQNTLTLKLATCGAYDNMTYEPNPYGFRDKELEDKVMQIAATTGYGAQFGGSNFALEAIVIRLSRHGASCPLSVGVSCSAHRNLKAILTDKGFYLEKTVLNPEDLPGAKECLNYLDSSDDTNSSAKTFFVNTDNGISSTLKELSNAKCGDKILLSGKLLVARDAAHARWQKLIDSDPQNGLPEYTKQYPICYAGPARTPKGKVIGSFGPTTAGRMDVYADTLMKNGAALITLAKGNRSKMWTDACKKYGAFYLGTPGGIAALIASKYIINQKIIDYEDLGMEAVRLITVKDLPCFVLTDKDGNDFYSSCGIKS